MLQYGPPSGPPPGPPSRPPKQGRGCCATGCLLFLAVLLILIGGGAAIYFRIPQQLGLLPSPERLLSATPDRAAAATIMGELKAAGVATTGLAIYVLPVEGASGTLEYAVLDPSAGFQFPASPAGVENPLFRMMTLLAGSPSINGAQVEQIAVEYRDESGQRLGTFTAKTSAVRAFAAGRITVEAFSSQVVGDVDPLVVLQSATSP